MNQESFTETNLVKAISLYLNLAMIIAMFCRKLANLLLIEE